MWSRGIKEKSVEPTNRMTFLGVTFDTVSMTLEVTPESHDNNLFTNTLPGLTQDEMKCNFPRL
jgi:hypothetical protein